jgi:hypothetical protein
LWTAILECKGDYLYSDTDSVKIINFDKHKKYFDKYNTVITNQLHKAVDILNISEEKLHPKTIKGIEKPLGIWDFDGHYKTFKTLGAKRYMVEYSEDPRNKGDKGKITLTVAGLNKKVAIPYLKQKYGNKIFENFDHNLYIPPTETGKNTHTYIDKEKEGVIEDYQGNIYKYKELSFVHLEAAEYSLKLSKVYRDLILDIQEGNL